MKNVLSIEHVANSLESEEKTILLMLFVCFFNLKIIFRVSVSHILISPSTYPATKYFSQFVKEIQLINSFPLLRITLSLNNKTNFKYYKTWP